ncbi:MAG: cytochrome c [Granulosicoccus sp.]
MKITASSFKPLRVLLPMVSILVTTASLASRGTDNIETALPADDPAVIAKGETVYQAQCAACHGAQLEGQPDWRSRGSNGRLPAPPHDAEGHTWHHADDLLFEITKYGPGPVIGDPDYLSDMPAFEKILSDEDIIAVLSYIKHSWPEEQRSWQAEVNGTSVEVFKPASKSDKLLDKLFK